MVKGIDGRVLDDIGEAVSPIVDDWRAGWGKNDEEKQEKAPSVTATSNTKLPNVSGVTVSGPDLGAELA